MCLSFLYTYMFLIFIFEPTGKKTKHHLRPSSHPLQIVFTPENKGTEPHIVKHTSPSLAPWSPCSSMIYIGLLRGQLGSEPTHTHTPSLAPLFAPVRLCIYRGSWKPSPRSGLRDLTHTIKKNISPPLWSPCSYMSFSRYNGKIFPLMT